MIPGGALPTTPCGASRPGSIGRHTGSRTIPTTTMAMAIAALSRRISGEPRRSGAVGSTTGPVMSTPAIAATAPSGHHATPRRA